MIARVKPPENAIDPGTRAQWRRWLQGHHGRGEGVWLVVYKKASGKPFQYEAAVEEALCFGWIDSRERSLDEQRTLLWMAPRKPKSAWSRSNKARVERLLAAGRMAAPGVAAIEQAKRSGSWSALDAVEALEIPADLARALAAAGAADNFAAFPPSARRDTLGWIQAARRPETRAKRIAHTAHLAAMNIRVHQTLIGPRRNK